MDSGYQLPHAKCFGAFSWIIRLYFSLQFSIYRFQFTSFQFMATNCPTLKWLSIYSSLTRLGCRSPDSDVESRNVNEDVFSHGSKICFYEGKIPFGVASGRGGLGKIWEIGSWKGSVAKRHLPREPPYPLSKAYLDGKFHLKNHHWCWEHFRFLCKATWSFHLWPSNLSEKRCYFSFLPL